MDIDLIKQHLLTARKDLHKEYGWNDLHAAIASGDAAIASGGKLPDKYEGLVNQSSRDGWTPLHVAVGLSGENKKNATDLLNTLIEKGADRNARNKDGWTPMHVAAALHHKHTACVVKKLAKCVDCFPDARDGKGRTALHIAAAKNKCPEVITTLCNNGYDVNAQDGAGNTPLHKAAEKTKNPEIVRLLLNKGANPWLKNGKGQLPFDLAERNKKLKGTEVYWRLHKGTYYPPPTKLTCACCDLMTCCELKGPTGDHSTGSCGPGRVAGDQIAPASTSTPTAPSNDAATGTEQPASRPPK